MAEPHKAVEGLKLLMTLFDFPINSRGRPGRLRGQGMEEASDCAVGEPTREAR